MTWGGRDVYVETGVGMAQDAGCAVWSFDPNLWGTCVQASTLDAALAAFVAQHGAVHVVETIHGDEQAFRRDHQPATDDELARTLAILDAQRARALALLASARADQLDAEHPERELPEWATWRTVRGMIWHICDTESRYYLPRCGLPSREPAADLETELAASARHVRDVLATMPRDLTVATRGEVWTSTKLLRRLAWHEAGELDVVEQLLGIQGPDTLRSWT